MLPLLSVAAAVLTLHGIDPKPTLVQLGMFSQRVWALLYHSADDDLRRILHESNFHLCREPDGYRIDVYLKDADAHKNAQEEVGYYKALGYAQARVLTPRETLALNPGLADFVQRNSVADRNDWTAGHCAIWR